MPDRVMFAQLKTGHNTERPSMDQRRLIQSLVEDRTLARERLRRWADMSDANFYDVETEGENWVSRTHRDGQDTRYSGIKPTIDHDARAAYEAFLTGSSLPGRERG